MMVRLVRELPPLRTTLELETPGGRFYRWGSDEPAPENVPSDLRWSSTMPGGWENASCVLPRDAARDYDDLSRLSTLTIRDAGLNIVGEYRLERTPRTSGQKMSISPNAVGWQAHLQDDKSATGVYVDLDLGRWRTPSNTRRLVLIAANAPLQDATVLPDATNGIPALAMTIRDTWASPASPICESWYDAGAGNYIGSVYSAWAGSHLSDTGFTARIGTSPSDGTTPESQNLPNTASGAETYDAPDSARRFAWVHWLPNATPGGADGAEYVHPFTTLAVFGTHGLTRRGAGAGGFYASDVVPHILATWAPLLTFTEGFAGTIRPSSYIIPQLAFHEPTTAAEMLKQAVRFELLDWAVWEHKTFWMHERAASGRSWRVRVGPAQLEETGPQADRVWESFIVAYRDVDGSTRTVGPPGSGADTESSDLQDSDPDNIAFRLGIRRRDLLQIGISTAAGATEVGRRFLQETKRLDTSGRARLVGHVEDDRGVLHPYTHVRAGDTITFVDAADPSPRRIVRADHSESERAVTVDLDAPPEGLQALLERLGAQLVALNLGG